MVSLSLDCSPSSPSPRVPVGLRSNPDFTPFPQARHRALRSFRFAPGRRTGWAYDRNEKDGARRARPAFRGHNRRDHGSPGTRAFEEEVFGTCNLSHSTSAAKTTLTASAS